MLALGLTVGSGLAAAGCLTTTEPDAQGVASSITPSTNVVPSDLGGLSATAEAMPVNLVGGGQLDLAAYMDKPLLLWFWAPF